MSNREDLRESTYRAGFIEGWAAAIRYARERLTDSAVREFKEGRDREAIVLREAPSWLSPIHDEESRQTAWDKYAVD